MPFASLVFSELDSAILITCTINKTGEKYENVIKFTDFFIPDYITFLSYIRESNTIVTQMTNILQNKKNVSVTFPTNIDRQYMTIDLLQT